MTLNPEAIDLVKDIIVISLKCQVIPFTEMQEFHPICVAFIPLSSWFHKDWSKWENLKKLLQAHIIRSLMFVIRTFPYSLFSGICVKKRFVDFCKSPFILNRSRLNLFNENTSVKANSWSWYGVSTSCVHLDRRNALQDNAFYFNFQRYHCIPVDVLQLSPNLFLNWIN